MEEQIIKRVLEVIKQISSEDEKWFVDEKGFCSFNFDDDGGKVIRNEQQMEVEVRKFVKRDLKKYGYVYIYIGKNDPQVVFETSQVGSSIEYDECLDMSDRKFDGLLFENWY